MKSLITIIVPIYKVEEYLSRCTESLLKQTYPNTEIILVDDGSPDRCPEFCDLYAEKYPSVRTIHKQNGGLASARLAGFLEAHGEYILYVDGDDYIHPQMVEKLVNAIQVEEAELAMCGYYRVDAHKTNSQLLPYRTNCISGRERIVQDYICPLIGYSNESINIPGFLCIRLLKKSLIQESFFGSERVYYKEDHVFDLLYADNIKKIAIVNEPLYAYCYNTDSLSNCYRKNKWGMYCNLYSFYIKYLKERNLQEINHRLDSFLVSAFCACIDNAVLTGKYSSFRKELDSILQSDIMQSVWTAVTRITVSNSAQLSLSLCRVRAFHVLYYIRKYRLNRNIM